MATWSGNMRKAGTGHNMVHKLQIHSHQDVCTQKSTTYQSLINSKLTAKRQEQGKTVQHTGKGEQQSEQSDLRKWTTEMSMSCLLRSSKTRLLACTLLTPSAICNSTIAASLFFSACINQRSVPTTARVLCITSQAQPVTSAAMYSLAQQFARAP